MGEQAYLQLNCERITIVASEERNTESHLSVNACQARLHLRGIAYIPTFTIRPDLSLLEHLHIY